MGDWVCSRCLGWRCLFFCLTAACVTQSVRGCIPTQSMGTINGTHWPPYDSSNSSKGKQVLRLIIPTLRVVTPAWTLCV